MLRLMTTPTDARKREPVPAPKKKRAPQFQFTPASDIRQKMVELEARGYGQSDGVSLMVRTYMDAQGELGESWWLVEKAAAEQRVGVGVILGRLAAATLEAQQRKK